MCSLRIDMKTLKTVVLALLWALCPLFSAFAQVQAPKFTVGDRWEYERTYLGNGATMGRHVQTVAQVEEGSIRMEVKTVTNDAVSYTFTPDGNITAAGARRFAPYYPLLKFPLVVGQEWSEWSTITTETGMQFSEQVKAKVVSEEEVKVPAGVFVALKIEVVAYYQGQAFREVNWYASSVKRMVKREVEERVGRGRKGPTWQDVLVAHTLGDATAQVKE